jgi:hypothetical protein
MNYELAKQLQDVGFPKDSYGVGDVFFTKDLSTDQIIGLVVMPDMMADAKTFSWLKAHVFVPTLSELIEACGPNFFALVRNDIELLWNAKKDRGDLGQKGLTPEEAVAKLWLALNKK